MDYDIILVGGGLANSLIAWKMAVEKPALRLLVIEQGERLGGNHTWSFYGGDLTAEQKEFLSPVIAHQWPGYEVRFPEFTRKVTTSYHTVTSEKLHETVSAILKGSIRYNTRIDEINGNVVVVNGQTITGKLVIDGRGFVASSHLFYAYQKFVGLEVRLLEPHGQQVPIIMDATIPQEDGFRFIYTLPLDSHTILIEDTYYSDQPDLDENYLIEKIKAYAASRNLEIQQIIRQEKGILPITLSGDIDAFWNEMPQDRVCSGLRANLFHQTTGYSLLYAMRIADIIVKSNNLDLLNTRKLIERFSKQLWLQQRFYRVLNRMLFYAAMPSQRYCLLQRFYKFPELLIERFYAGQLQLLDKLRLVSGKPPVPVLKALKAILTFRKEKK